jgi:hypothetical protein
MEAENITTGAPGQASPAKPALSFDGMTGAEIDAMHPDEFADTLFATMEKAEAALTYEDMDQIEAMWNQQRRERRYSLVMLTMPWADLNQKVAEDRDFALAVAEVMQYANETKFYSGVADLIERAGTWAMVALAGREDGKELLAESQGKGSA